MDNCTNADYLNEYGCSYMRKCSQLAFLSKEFSHDHSIFNKHVSGVQRQYFNVYTEQNSLHESTFTKEFYYAVGQGMMVWQQKHLTFTVSDEWLLFDYLDFAGFPMQKAKNSFRKDNLYTWDSPT